jgi:uncharacterized protein (TIGR00369 family)
MSKRNLNKRSNNCVEDPKMPENINSEWTALEAFRHGDGHPAMLSTSPLLVALGCQIEDVGQGQVSLGYSPGVEQVQGNGVIAGGAVATMLDFALACAALTTCAKGETAISIGLNVCFLGPVYPGRVKVEARLVSDGFRIAQAEARLMDTDSRVLATATSGLLLKRGARND